MFYYDYTYVLFMLPCIIISLICQVRVKTAFSKYSKIVLYRSRSRSSFL